MSKDNYNQHKYHSSEGDEEKPNFMPSRPYERRGSKEDYAHEVKDGIDFIELAQRFWIDRIIIAKITVTVLLVGLFIAVFSSVEYQTDAVLLPEIQSSSNSAENLLNQYGGLLGISGGSLSSGQQSTIPPQLYPQIIESIPYQVELMNTPIMFGEYDTTATTYKFFQDIYHPSLIGYIKAFTIGLPGLLSRTFKNGNSTLAQNNSPLDLTNRDSLFSLTEKQWWTIEQLRDRVNVSIDVETGVVTLSTTMPDAQATAELGRAGIRILKEYVREYRTKNIKKDLKYVKSQVRRANTDFETAQQNLNKFRDRNLTLSSARAKSQEQDLQSEYDLAFNTYNLLRQKLEQTKLQLQEQTPVFSILQPVTVPLKKSHPRRILILIVSLILGLILGLGWSLVRGWGKEIFSKIPSNNSNVDKKNNYS